MGEPMSEKLNIFNLIVLIVACLGFTGCTTFGSFGNLKQNETTRAEVENLLGEPQEIRSDDDTEYWKYVFVKPSKTKTVKVLETNIALESGVVKDYQISVVTKNLKDRAPSTGPGRAGSGQGNNKGTMSPRAKQLLYKHDKNRDGIIDAREYSASVDLFKRIDLNNDRRLDHAELMRLKGR